MKKILFLLVLLATFTSQIHAQKNEDVVYLINGGVIRGKIIEQIPNKTVKIKSEDGEIFVLNVDEISKIEKEENTSSNGEKGTNSQPTKIKYIGIIEPSFGKGLSDNSDVHSLGVRVINGVICNDAFAFGLGLGVDGYAASIGNWNSTYFFPVSLDIRGYFIKNSVSPYLSADIGYSVLLNGEPGFLGGLMLNPVLGVKIGKEDAVFIVGVGYRLQDYMYEQDTFYFNGSGVNTSKHYTTFNASFLDFRIGVTF